MYNVQRTATIRAMSSCRLWKMDRFIYLDLLLRDAKAQRQRLVDFVKEQKVFSGLTAEQAAGVAELLQPVVLPAAAEYAAWAAPPPEQAPATPAGGLRIAAWPVTYNRTFPVDPAALQPWGDAIDAPAGPGGAAAVAVVSAKPCAAAALEVANATCVGCGVVRRLAAGGAASAVVFAGRRVRELAFRCDGDLLRTRLRVKAVRGGPRCALPAAAGRSKGRYGR